MKEKRLISNIQRFSLDDGPGIRTTIFFKGCNLKCLWCHNPECIPSHPLLQLTENTCLRCGKCAKVCTNQVHMITETEHRLDRSLCGLCGKCVEICRQDSLKIIGTEYENDEIISIIKKDMEFYKTSGGGVTFSGGEPMLAMPKLKELLIECKKLELNTAVDTAGNVPFNLYQEIMPYVDLFLYDIKLLNSDLHKKYTGVSNELILENIKLISQTGKDIFIRIPVIGSVNDNLAELKSIAEFITGLKSVKLVQLLPYHNYGIGKYEALGIESRQSMCYTPSPEFMKEMLEVFTEMGINKVSF